MHLFFAFSTYSKAKRQLGKKSIINLQTAFANSASQAPFFLPFPQNPYTTSLPPLNNTGICPSTPTFTINNIHSHPACPHYCHKKTTYRQIQTTRQFVFTKSDPKTPSCRIFSSPDNFNHMSIWKRLETLTLKTLKAQLTKLYHCALR